MTYNWWEKKREWTKEYLQNVSLTVCSIPNPKLGNIGFWAGYRSTDRFILHTAFLEIVSSWCRLFSIHASIGSLCANDKLPYRKELIGAPPEQKRIQGEGKLPKVWQQTKTPIAMTNPVSHNWRLEAPCNTSSKQQNGKDQSQHYWQGNPSHNCEAPYRGSISPFMNTKC